MKRFAFRLQRVLDYRQSLKKESERELLEKNNHLNECEKQLDEIISEQDKCMVRDENVLMSGAEVVLQGDYKHKLQEALVQQRLLVLEAIDAVQSARDLYIRRSMEQEVLDNLRQRKVDEYRQDKRRHEQKDMDELVVQRHRFKHK